MLDSTQLQQFIENVLPALFFLAFISVLFNTVRTLSRRAALAILFLIMLSLLPAPVAVAATVPQIYYFDVGAKGLYYINMTGTVIDAYGSPVTAYVDVDNTYHGMVVDIPVPGRYYLIPGSCTTCGKVDILDIDKSNSTFGQQNTITQYGLSVRVSGSTTMRAFYLHEPANASISITANLPRIEIKVNGTLYKTINQKSATVQLPRGDIEIWGYDGTVQKTVYTVFNNAIDIDQIQQVTVNTVTATPVAVNVAQSNVLVYAHRVLINASKHYMNVFVVPVDDSEVYPLLSGQYSIAVMHNSTVMPAMLVEINGSKYAIFRSWVQASGPVEYYIIWNYPQPLPLDPLINGIFVEKLDGDPLLVWQELLSSNVSLVQYDANSRKLVVQGSGFEYALGSALGFNASMVVGWLKNGSVGVGYVPGITLSGLVAADNTGIIYRLNTTNTATEIALEFHSIGSVNVTNATASSIVVHLQSNARAEWYGAFAADAMTPYVAAFNKQLLRIAINVTAAELHSVRDAPGYWRYAVPVTVTFDPSTIPSQVSEVVVRLELPEQLWVQQGIAKPGLPDIAIVTDTGKLLRFWVEPFQQPDGSRGVWVRIPVDRMKTIYGLYVYLDNPQLQSSLSTLDTFDVYFDDAKGPGATWSLDGYGYYSVQAPYMNTIVFIPRSGYSVKLGLTPDDFYYINSGGIYERHSSYETLVQGIGGLVSLQATHYIQADVDNGRLAYAVNGEPILDISGLNKPYVWPPVVWGHANVTFAGLAYMPVQYSYSVGSVFGGSWGQDQQATGQYTATLDWRALAPLLLLMLGIAIFNRLMESGGPRIVVERRPGAF